MANIHKPSKIEQAGVAGKVLDLSLRHDIRTIARILKEENGLDVSHTTVHNFIREMRKDQAEQTKAIVREHIASTLPTDLQILDEIISQEREWFNSPQLKPGEKIAVAKELRQTIDTKLKYTGAGEQETEIVFKWDDGKEDNPD